MASGRNGTLGTNAAASVIGEYKRADAPVPIPLLATEGDTVPESRARDVFATPNLAPVG